MVNLLVKLTRILVTLVNLPWPQSIESFVGAKGMADLRGGCHHGQAPGDYEYDQDITRISLEYTGTYWNITRIYQDLLEHYETITGTY